VAVPYAVPRSVTRSVPRSVPDRLFGGASMAALLLGSEANGLAFSAEDMSMVIRDVATPANAYSSSGIVNSSGTPIGIGGKLTYSAPSAKLCLQADGTYKYNAHNLCTYSEDFSVWTKSAALTRTTGITDPRGGTTAANFSGFTGGFQAINPTSASSVVGESYTFDIWILGTGTITLDWNGWTGAATCTLTGAWAKYTVTTVAQTTSAAPRIISYGGQTATAVSLAFGHIRLANSNTDYITTTSAALYALPYEYDTSGLPLGIRVEESRANLLLRSTEISNASWSKTDATVSADATTAPDGTLTADKLIEGSATSEHMTSQSAVTTAAAHTFSIFAKAGERTFIMLYHAQSTSARVFDLSAGTVGGTAGLGTPTTSTIEALPDGWYRCAIVVTATAASNSFRAYICSDASTYSYSGNSASGLFLWGAQLELGGFATSPIITYGTSLTRLADDITLAGTAFPLSASQGILAARWRYLSSAVGANAGIGLYGPNSQNLVDMRTTQMLVSSANVNVAAMSAGSISTSSARRAMSYALNDFAATYNGGTVATDTGGDAPVTLTILRLHVAATTLCLNGHLSELLYLPRNRASNAELQGFLA
jgi:hypothetical protein